MVCTYCLKYPMVADKDSPLSKGAGGEGNFRKESLTFHSKSKLHVKCQEKYESENRPNYAGPLKKMSLTLGENVCKQIGCLFNTSFYVAKQGQSFESFQGLCELQEKNGVDLGFKYKNDKACATFINNIATNEVKAISQELKHARFLSEGVLAAIDEAVETVGVTQEILVSKLVGCNFDGAAVMMGKKSVYCVAHNLELGVLDAVKTVPYLRQFDDTVKGVFKYYFYSPKKRRELKAISEIIEEDYAYYSGVQQIRWLASRHRSLAALEKHYAVTIYHLEHVGQGTGEDSARSKGLLRELKTEKFVKFLHFMIDVTSVLKHLSECYQRDELFISDVVRKLELASWELSELKENGPDTGEFYSKFVQSYSDGVFKCGKESAQSVSLTNKGANLIGTFTTFLGEVVQYISNRFGSLQDPPYADFQVFDHTLWPVDLNELRSFGNNQVAKLTDHFKDCLSEDDTNGTSAEWLDLKLRLNRQRSSPPQTVYANLLMLNPDNLQHILALVNIMITLSPCTAVCERAFSSMNKLKTTYRSQMKQTTLQNLMRIKQMQQNVSTFDANEAINIWLCSAKTCRQVAGKSDDVKTVTNAPDAAAEPTDLPELPQLEDSDSDSD
ncbi:zinc finger protein 862-like [Ylistrum balloti]|uniref:zinc finger protein 862-like n=1 Tax=Ylistrum balloti TaxID=509963 RepID=UPI0029058D60|nr:zinc finger protein 862-like [Ylistrum balloti]